MNAPQHTRVTVLHTRLSDGRDLFYFDDSVDPVRVLTDGRDLPVVEPASVVRFDALQREWVGIAGHRQSRTYHPPANQCPLCPTRATFQTEIPSPDYDVVVFENRFPSFAGASGPDELLGVTTGGTDPDGGEVIQREMRGIGRCEVVCFTSDHDAEFVDLPHERVQTVIEAWVHRTEALNAIPGMHQVFCFMNQGVEIGVTLAHPHGQIYGYPFIPPKIRAILDSVSDYRSRTGANLFADLLDSEIRDARRIVAANDHWVAFVPFAARWPVEVSIFPRRMVPDLPATTPEERAALARIYLEVVTRMGGIFDDTLPAITAIYQAPAHTGRDDFWLHLSVFSIRRAVGKIKYLAGSESGMGAFVNDMSPELVAAGLRDVVI